MPKALSTEHLTRNQTLFNHIQRIAYQHRTRKEKVYVGACMKQIQRWITLMKSMNMHRLHESWSSECSHSHNNIEQNKYYEPEAINDFMFNMNNRNLLKPNLTWQPLKQCEQWKQMKHDTTKTSTSLSNLGLCTTTSLLDPFEISRIQNPNVHLMI